MLLPLPRSPTSSGEIDLPTMIDFILLNTGRLDLHYIGHSQGTTFTMASLRMEMNAKVRTMHALSKSLEQIFAGAFCAK